MIGEICAEIKNYFAYENDKHIGDWEISNGTISPILVLQADYIRIVGSRFNDGVHKVSKLHETLRDESFHGAIWIMSPPKDFLDLVEEISKWQEKNGSVDSLAMSPFYSESFGGYYYLKSQGNGGGTTTTWVNVYSARLNKYRRIREL